MSNFSYNSYVILKYLSLISIIVIIVHYVLKHILKNLQEKFAGDDDDFYLNHPTLNPNSSFEEKILFHIEEIKDLAHKISEEKKAFEPYMAMSDASEVLEKYSKFRKEVQSQLEAEERMNQIRYQELQDRLTDLQKQVIVYKSEMESLVKSWLSPYDATEQLPKSRRLLGESGAQTEDTCSIFYNDDLETEVSQVDLMAIKDSMISLTQESEKEWLNDVLKSIETLESGYIDVKSLIMSYWGEISGEISACGSILDKVQRVEQTVFGILLFLQQQSFDAQTVRETLKFFDHKFEKFMKRSKSRWKVSNSKLEQAFESIRQTQSTLDERSSDFIENSMGVAQHLTYLEMLVKQFTGIAKLVHDAERLTNSVEKNICSLAANMTLVSAKIEGDYCQKLKHLSEALLKPGEKLYVLYKTTEDLHLFTEFLKNVPSSTTVSSSVLSTISELESMQQPVCTTIVTEAIGYGNIITTEGLEGIRKSDSNQEQNFSKDESDSSSKVIEHKLPPVKVTVSNNVYLQSPEKSLRITSSPEKLLRKTSENDLSNKKPHFSEDCVKENNFDKSNSSSISVEE